MSVLTCPSQETLMAFASGKVDDEQLSLVSEHLTYCFECDSTIAKLDSDDNSIVAMLRSPQAAPFAKEPEYEQAMKALQSEPRGRGEGFHQSFLPETEDSVHEYELLGVIGRGGMGVVHRARHRRLGHQVALKILPVHRHSDAASTSRFEREFAAVGKLHHPNIVKAYDAGDANGLHFLVMELIDGVNLHQLVKRQGPLQVADACEIIRRAALGLHHAHQHGLVHRDMKPSNVLLSRRGEVKVLDLGLALLQDDHHGEELTCTGQVMGTLDYMSPEQAADSHRVDHRTDLYGLGCTLFKLLTGHPPFSGRDYRSPAAKILAHANIEPPRLSEHCDGIPEELDELVSCLLEKDPERRPATTKELADCLEPLAVGHDLESLGTSIGPVEADFDAAVDDAEIAVMLQTDRPRRRLRSGHWLTTLLLCAIVAAGVIIIRFRDENGKEHSVEVADDVNAKIFHNGKRIAEVNPTIKNNVDSQSLRDEAIQQLTNRHWLDLLKLSTNVDIHGDALPPGVIGRLGTNRFWMGGNYAAFSPDGRVLASANADVKDNTIYLWDLATGQQMRQLKGHAGTVSSAVFSLDGKTLASAGAKGTIFFWDVARGAERFRVKHDGPIRANLVISPDGKFFASGSMDRTVRLWEVATGREVRKFEGHGNEVRAVAFSRDGSTLASAGSDDMICFWNVATGEKELQIKAGQRQVLSIAFSPDGKILASGGEDHLKLWELPAVNSTFLVEKEEIMAFSVAFSPDGKWFAGGGRLWNAKEWRPVRELSGTETSTQSLVFSPDGNLLATADGGLWNVDTGSDPRDGLGFVRAGSLAKFTSDGKQMVTAGYPGTIHVWDAATGRHVRELTNERKYHKQFFITPDGEGVIVGNGILDITTGRIRRTLTANEKAPPDVVALASDGRMAVSREINGPFRTWNIETGEETGQLNLDTSVYHIYDIAFSPDGRTFAASFIDYSDQRKHVISFFNRATGQRLHSAVVRNADCSLIYSPDGRLLVSDYGCLDATTGEPVYTVPDGRRWFGRKSFSPDGRLLACATTKHTALIVDTSTFRKLVELEGHRDTIDSLQFTPDGTHLATGSRDGTVLIWEVAALRDEHWPSDDRDESPAADEP